MEKFSRAFPILAARGIVILALACMIPLAGLTLQLPLRATSFLVASYLSLFIFRLFLEGRHVSTWAAMVNFSQGLPSVVPAGKAQPFALEGIIPGEGILAAQIVVETVPAIEILPWAQEGVLVSRAGETVVTFPLTLRGLERGEHHIPGAVLRFRPRRGLAWWQVEYCCNPPAVISVIPDETCGDEALQSFQARIRSGTHMLRQSTRAIGEFESLRNYSSGDDLRLIDWKHSARTEQLIVKEFRPDSHQRVLVGVDCSRRSGARLRERLQLDYTVDMAAMLLRLAEESQDEAGLLAFHHSEIFYQSPGRLARSGRSIRSALTAIQPGRLEADYMLLTQRALQSTKRSLVLLLTSLANPASVELIANALLPLRQRHVPLVVALLDEELERMRLQKGENLQDAYLIAAAEEQRRLVEERMMALRREGVRALIGSVETLPRALRQEYLHLKRSAAL